MPAKLNIEKARPREGYEIRDDTSPQQQRMGTSRTASEPRGPPRRANTERNRPRKKASDEDEEYPDEVYDMYSSPRSSQKGGNRRQPRYIEEEEEDGSDYDDDFDEGDFEMVSARNPPPRSTGRAPSSVGRGQSKRPEVRKIRVKVHADDVRYIMIGVAIEFPDMVDKIREKFGLRKRFKIKVRDDDIPDGDMITMGDQDDLEMVIMSVKSQARKERLDMGKMEVSLKSPINSSNTKY